MCFQLHSYENTMSVKWHKHILRMKGEMEKTVEDIPLPF